MEEPDAVGARHDAVAATDAPFPVDQHNTIVGLISRAHRADLHTCRVFALITELRHEESLRNFVGIDLFIPDQVADETVAATQWRIDMRLPVPGNDVTLYPGSRDGGIERYFIFFFACRDTQAATDTPPRIDEECPSRLRFRDNRFCFVCRQ
jgi:hypothetical protein